MASGNKFNEALKLILEDLNNKSSAVVHIKALEAENTQLRQKKIELITKLNCHAAVYNSIVFVKDMLSRQQSLNQTRSESKDQAALRFKGRKCEGVAQIVLWKQKMQGIDNLMTLPHNEVQEKILDMEKKIAANYVKINELTQEQTQLKQSQLKGTDDLLNLNEILKGVEKDQMKLIQTLNEEDQPNNEIKG